MTVGQDLVWQNFVQGFGLLVRPSDGMFFLSASGSTLLVSLWLVGGVFPLGFSWWKGLPLQGKLRELLSLKF